ncbi:FliM/FliN family flagellar motor switch protein [Hyphomonas sp.]|uniref:FliM/FliN family flagellar motor switch protein n=1 Tax=Hyphomonas sp. TaxID=87 RepID=UPI0039193E9A
MSSVLQKKIESGAGLPPTILRYQAFWDSLQAVVAPWAEVNLNGGVLPHPEIRRVLPGPEARELLERRTVNYFNSRMSPGVCAVATDGPGAARIAATRLSQDVETASEAPALFLKLMFEAPSVSLWRALAEEFEGHDAETPASPLAEPSLASGGFEASRRYLLAAYTAMPESLRAQIWVVFDLDYLLAGAAEAERLALLGKRPSGTHMRSLHDSVMTSAIRLDAVLERVPMTVGECSRLKVGDVLPLPETDPRFVTLHAETVSGSLEIGQCEMGVWKRHRALKLKEPVLKSFTEEIARM